MQVKLWAARASTTVVLWLCCALLLATSRELASIARARVASSGGLDYLHPGLKHGRMSPHEERLILELHARWGNREWRPRRHASAYKTND
ncbi:hypothetical protein ABZP36_002217 [Zizania latifolia]